MVLGAALLVSGGCGYKNLPVPPESVVPKAIEDLRYTLQDDGVRMTWSYPLETIQGSDITEVASFDLLRAEIPLDDYCPTCPVPFTEPIQVDGGVCVVDGKRRTATYDYGLLRTGHKYFFKVQARKDWWASSADSNIITFVWNERLPAPSGLSVTAKDSSVQLRWQPVAGYDDGRPVEEGVQYQVLRQVGSGAFAKLGEPTSATAYVDGAVKNGQKYSYQVQSVMLFGTDLVDGGKSEAFSVTPVDTTPPPVPSGVMAVRTGSGIRVIWDGSMDADITGYRIYRRTAAGSAFSLIGKVNSPSTTFVDSSAAEDVRYYYTVTAVDNSNPANESGKSKEATLRH
jgi:fibronectin type 3 domain-containing protein